MILLRAHFISFASVGEGALFIYEIRRDDTGAALIHLSRACIQMLVFHYALKFRGERVQVAELRAEIERVVDIDAFRKYFRTSRRCCHFHPRL